MSNGAGQWPMFLVRDVIRAPIKCERLDSVSGPTNLLLLREARKSGKNSHSRPWTVLLDGNVVATVTSGDTVAIDAQPGHHELRVAASALLRSPDLSIDVSERETLSFSCRPRAPHPARFSLWVIWLVASLARPGLWIDLRADDSVVLPHVDRPTNTAAAPLTTMSAPVRAALAESTAQSRPTGDSVLVVQNLTKQFGSRTAFSDVSFEVGYGEVFGFLGPNGAGKTTTVRTLGTLIAPTAGSATVAGIPLLPENGVEIRQRIAIMPEAPGLYLRLSVRENLAYFAGLYGLHHADKRIGEALESVNLNDRANDLCGGLSKGLRQRVSLARTLLSDPAIMFLDEPTSGLDPVASLEVQNLIIALKAKGVTVFLTTHRLDEAEKLCDRVAFMNTKLRTVGRTDDLRRQLFQRALLVKTVSPLSDPTSLFSGVSAIEEWKVNDDGTYVLTVADPNVVAPEVTRALVSAGADVLSIAESQHSLEDVYLELIADDVEAKTS
jgi:ABC-2 type transport system ATP-binding protein